MSKRSAKIAATYFLTIIVSFFLIGGVGYFLVTRYLDGEEEGGLAPTAEMQTAAQNEEYSPDSADAQTVLFIYEEEKRASGVCFVLARFIPQADKAVIVPLRSDIKAELDGKSNTLYEFYRLGGTGDAVDAVESVLGVRPERYLKFTSESFTMFSDFMGNITYNVPYNLVYEDQSTGESIIVRSGSQTLDSATLRKVLTFPDYKNGEEERSIVVGTIITELVNSGAKGILKTGLDTVFTDIINADIETDITRYDYDEKKPAIEYVLDRTNSPAQLVLPSGTEDENGFCAVDESFINALPKWLLLEAG